MSVLLRDEIIKCLLSGEIYVSGMPKSKDKDAFGLWCDKFVQPASLDLPTGRYFWLENTRSGRLFAATTEWFIVQTDDTAEKQFKLWDSEEHGELLLGPKKYALGHTADTIGLSPTIAATVLTRSTAGRWGIDTRRSAGFIDPGYRGPVTLEIHNDSSRLMPIVPGISYCQMVFQRGIGAEAPYDGHYRVKENDEWTPQRMLPKALTK